MGGYSMIVFVVLMAGMMFFMTRSQKKQQQKRQNVLDSLKVGDNVVTIGGLHGVASEINTVDKTVLIDCEGIVLEFDRAAIKTIVPATTTTTAPVEPAKTVEHAEVVDPKDKEDKIVKP
jgi:preprotein translocase subunit YajC